MSRPRYTEERFMSILWTIYERTSNGKYLANYNDFCKEMRVTNSLFPILESNRILKTTLNKSDFSRGKGTKLYVWNTIQPNIHMARKLMEEIKKYVKEANAKARAKKANREELELLQDKQLQQEQLQQEQKWVVIDMPETTIATPRIETQTQFNAPPPQTIQNPFQTVTISSDQPLPQIKKEKNKKKFSIAWGLISIEW